MSARPTGHLDTYVQDRLPPRDAWPVLLPGPDYPETLNAADALLRGAIEAGHEDRVALRGRGASWTYAALDDRVSRIARVLSEAGLVPGGRVLLRAANTPDAAAAWLGILRAGGVAVATMPLLRAKELRAVIEKARPVLALCDGTLRGELDLALDALGEEADGVRVLTMEGGALEAAADRAAPGFESVATRADDPALLAFTSGTTGAPKACVHFHRDVLVMADTFSAYVLDPRPDDVFIGSPPLAFTFGLGALLVFPLRAGATAVLPGMLGPAALMEAAAAYGATLMFTAPTAYRVALPEPGFALPPTVRVCVSAGEALPKATSEAWMAATGLRLIDGIGSTEMIHIFVSARADEARPGSTGRALPGFEARVVDEDWADCADGVPGRLVVRGPVGCRYMDDARQAEYVQRGWNVTGDVFVRDADGYLSYVARADDMIVTGGYNVAGAEVEDAVLSHPGVAECAVVGAPCEERGSVVCAYVVPANGAADAALRADIQRHVKDRIAPYKYPRRVEIVEALPKTATGKVRRHALREAARGA